MRPSQNLPFPPRIYPFEQLYATLPGSTLPSQNIPPFEQLCATIQDLPLPPRIPPLSTNLYVRPSQNLPFPLRIYPPLNNCMRPSQNLPLPPRIYPLLHKFICATLPESTPPSHNKPPLSTTSRIYPSLPEYTPFSTNLYVRPSQNLPLPPKIYPPLNNYIRPSQNLSLPCRIYQS